MLIMGFLSGCASFFCSQRLLSRQGGDGEREVCPHTDTPGSRSQSRPTHLILRVTKLSRDLILLNVSLDDLELLVLRHRPFPHVGTARSHGALSRWNRRVIRTFGLQAVTMVCFSLPWCGGGLEPRLSAQRRPEHFKMVEKALILAEHPAPKLTRSSHKDPISHPDILTTRPQGGQDALAGSASAVRGVGHRERQPTATPGVTPTAASASAAATSAAGTGAAPRGEARTDGPRSQAA